MGAQRCCVPRFPHRLSGKPQTPNVGEGGTSWAGPGRAGKAVGRVGWEHPPKAPKYPAKVFNTGIKLEIHPNLLIVCYYPKNRKELKMTAPPHKDPRSQAPFSPSPPPVSMETAKYWGAKPSAPPTTNYRAASGLGQVPGGGPWGFPLLPPPHGAEAAHFITPMPPRSPGTNPWGGTLGNHLTYPLPSYR